jgi:polyribonucleotide nucleotidyltransferase
MGGGKRINSVDDVLELGQVVKVKVEEIDDKGKVSLMLSEELEIPEGVTGGSGRDDRPPRRERSDRGSREGGRDSAPAAEPASDIVEVSFEDSFDAELAGELGDLGPKGDRPAERDGGNRRGGARRRHR